MCLLVSSQEFILFLITHQCIQLSKDNKVRMMSESWLTKLISCMKCEYPSPPESKEAGKDREVNSMAAATETKRPQGWKCVPYIIGNETFEKVASFGLTANFTVYLVKRFNMEQVVAANMANIFFGTTNFAPLVGAFISDGYWGRFRTLAYGSIVSFLGMVTLTLTSVVPQLMPPSCSPEAQNAGHCAGPSKLQLGVLLLSLALLVIGAGGVRPCSLPFGVDQFDRTTEKGERGLNSFFNWYYCTTTAAIMISMTLVVYIQNDISWPIGFSIPTCLMLLSIISFFLGAKLYVFVPPEGSVFSGIPQVFVASFRKRSLQLPSPALLYDPPLESERVMKLPLSSRFRILNKAAIIREGEVRPNGSPANKWTLCSVQQIEEVKCLIRIIPIWAAGIITFVAMAQQWTFTMLQALKMDRHLGSHFEIAPGSLVTISMLTLTVFMPIYDQIIVPLARRVTKIDSGITLLQRQGVGIIVASISMVVAGLVENMRRVSALSHSGVHGSSPLSVMWLAPQLMLMGVAEAFSAVGQIEFYNRQFPEHMQTLAGSLFFCSLSGSSYLSSLLVAVVQKASRGYNHGTSWLDNNINVGRLDYFYYFVAVFGVANFFYFLVCAHYYRYKAAPQVRVAEERDGKEMRMIP